MKSISDQLDFDFSRPLDIQRNINLNVINNCVDQIFEERKVNNLFIKHLRLLILELYFCWSESNSQFLCVSMSKRGYKSKSRYNPNNISSYLIKTIQFLQKNNLIDFFPGFYDSRTKKSRLSRIRASKKLINYFYKIKSWDKNNFNHLKREFILIYAKGKLYEYPDTYETNETGQILRYYNNLISNNLFDIPDQNEEFLIRADKRKIVISSFSSCSYSFDADNPTDAIINGCWWNKLDLNLFLKVRDKLIINDQSTSHFSFLDYFGEYLTKISNTNIILKPKTFSNIFNFDQLCYLTMKYFRSNNNKNFIKSVLIEKKKINLESYSNQEIKNALINSILSNSGFIPFINKKINLKWDEFISKCFFLLITKFSSVNIPLYLVRDKVYFPSDKESLISEKIEEILSKLLDLNSVKIDCNKSQDFGFEKKGLFARFRNKNKIITRRYLENKRNIGIG